MIGDEAAFQMNGKVSTRNVVRYAPRGQNPLIHYDVPESRDKINVWAALCGDGTVLGPFFFDENLTGIAYLNLLNEEIVPQMMTVFDFNLIQNVLFEQLWWFQDGAPPHRAIVVRDRLNELFGDQVVALYHNQEWPPRSPDLTPCDFFLWGYIKSRVYRSPPNDVFDLRNRIIREFELLDRNMVLNAMRAMETRARKCIQENGRHVEGI